MQVYISKIINNLICIIEIIYLILINYLFNNNNIYFIYIIYLLNNKFIIIFYIE